MSSDEDNDAFPAQCEGNHSPACPNRFFCTCVREESTEDDAMAVLLEQEREGVLDVNAVLEKRPCIYSARRTGYG